MLRFYIVITPQMILHQSELIDIYTLIPFLPMKNDSTLLSQRTDLMSMHCRTGAGAKSKNCNPKPDTLERIRQYARVAFSDTALAAFPVIVLN